MYLLWGHPICIYCYVIILGKADMAAKKLRAGKGRGI